ncbi:MAG: hypothetical protein H6612_12370 [Ignavibacteriales bacterium]|nr:hypothetical protein [Ignavibacteriales bacterium]
MNNFTKLFFVLTSLRFNVFTICLFTFAFSHLILLQAQEIKTISKDSIQSANIKLPNAPTVTGDKVEIKNTTGNSIITITDEGSNKGSITLPSMTSPPSSTTNKLYNDGGTLKFNGSSLGGGSGASSINDLSDAKSNSANTLYLGNSSGSASSTSTENTAVGIGALSNNIGNSNTAVGTAAGAGAGGSNNSFLGVGAGANNELGSNNTFIGTEAGLGDAVAAIFPSGSVFIGYQAGANELNSNRLFIDNSSTSSPLIWGNFTNGSELVKINGNFFVNGNVNSQGNNNNAFGLNSLLSNTTGNFNTAMGQGALYTNTTGGGNVAIGFQAGFFNETGEQNTFVGNQAGRNTANTSGSRNVFLGYQAGYSEVNSDRLYIDNSSTNEPLIWGNFQSNLAAINGKLGIGNINSNMAPSALLDIDAASSEIAMNVDVGGATKFKINQNGGTTIGSNNQPPLNGLNVSGDVKMNGDAEIDGNTDIGGNTILNGSAQIGSNGTPFFEIKKVSGTISNVDNDYASGSINYPSGFDENNTFILSAKIGDHAYGYGYTQFYDHNFVRIATYSSSIAIYTFKSKSTDGLPPLNESIVLILMKMN